MEHADGVAARKQVEGVAVVERNIGQGEIEALGSGDEVTRPRKNGQVGESQEVHLQKSQVGAGIHCILSHCDAGAVVGAARGPLKGHDVVERFLRDDYGCGVGAGVAGQSFQALSVVYEPFYGLVGVVDFLHLRALLKRVVQSDIEAIGHETRDAINIAVGHCKSATDIADCSLRAECSEGDYLRDVLSAVLIDDIVDDFFAAVVLEVHVDVGHLLALDIEEALENEAVRERVDIGDAEAVEDEARCRAAANCEEDVPLMHELGDVPDDEEVVGELRLLYDIKLVVEASALCFACVRHAPGQFFMTYLRKVLIG